MDPRMSERDVNAPDPKQPAERPKSESARKEDARLDEELDETFPASDPVPYRHDG